MAMSAGGRYMQHRQQSSANEEAQKRAAMQNLVGTISGGGMGGGGGGAGYQQPGMGAQMLSDPMTQKLVMHLLPKLFGG